MKTSDLILDYYKGVHGIKNTIEWGDWRINTKNPSKKYKLPISDLRPLLCDKRLEIINFIDIAYKSFNLPRSKTHENCICCGGKRYNNIENHDLIYPPILLKGKKYNNFNKEYRMLDGKHRMMHLVEKMKKSNYYFFVLNYDEIKKQILTNIKV